MARFSFTASGNSTKVSDNHKPVQATGTIEAKTERDAYRVIEDMSETAGVSFISARVKRES